MDLMVTHHVANEQKNTQTVQSLKFLDASVDILWMETMVLQAKDASVGRNNWLCYCAPKEEHTCCAPHLKVRDDLCKLIGNMSDV